MNTKAFPGPETKPEPEKEYYKNVILLTGGIGAGKSTVARNVVNRLLDEKTIGPEDIFGYTTERLSGPDGDLEGFEIVTYGGERCRLASVKRISEHKYMGLFVNLDAFDVALTAEFGRAKKHPRPVLHIDEIGLMEKRSPRYISMLTDLLANCGFPVIAAVKLAPEDDFLDKIKGLDNADLLTVTENNRRAVEIEVFEKFSAVVKNINPRRP